MVKIQKKLPLLNERILNQASNINPKKKNTTIKISKISFKLAKNKRKISNYLTIVTQKKQIISLNKDIHLPSLSYPLRTTGTTIGANVGAIIWTIIATFTASATATATSTFTAYATATRMFIASTNAQSNFLISRNKTLNRVPFNTNESGTNKKKTKHVKKLKPNKKITKLNE